MIFDERQVYRDRMEWLSSYFLQLLDSRQHVTAGDVYAREVLCRTVMTRAFVCVCVCLRWAGVGVGIGCGGSSATAK